MRSRMNDATRYRLPDEDTDGMSWVEIMRAAGRVLFYAAMIGTSAALMWGLVYVMAAAVTGFVGYP